MATEGHVDAPAPPPALCPRSCPPAQPGAGAAPAGPAPCPQAWSCPVPSEASCRPRCWGLGVPTPTARSCGHRAAIPVGDHSPCVESGGVDRV